MRISDSVGTFESNMSMAPRAFQISASSKAFQILSDTLYKQKELAVVRELLANAVDAHVAASTTDVPFNIHLPTTLEPWFEIEDFGTGLSDEAIHTLYTTYFSSDKTGSNELIGGFGLGSKSPFAYTDQFFVGSRKNGEEIKYNIFIAASGTPMISKMSASKTDCANGLTVRVPVALAHISAFERAALEICPHITVRYTINRLQSDIDAKRPVASMEFIDPATNCRIVISDSVAAPVVVCGIVPYPLELRILTNVSEAPLSAFGIYIYAPIGLLEITASREGLSYNANTKRVLNELMISISQWLVDQYGPMLDAKPTLLEAMIFSAEQQWKIDSLAHSLNQSTKIPNSWGGIPLNRYPISPGMMIRIMSCLNYGRKQWRIEELTPENNHRSIGSQDTFAKQVYWSENNQLVQHKHWLEDNTIRLPATILCGDKTTVETFCEDLGLDFSGLIEIPKYKRPRSTTNTMRGTRNTPTEQKYSVIAYPRATASQATKEELARWLGERTPIFIGTELSSPMRALRDEKAKFLWALIPASHTRVHNALRSAGAWDASTPTKDLVGAFIKLDDTKFYQRLAMHAIDYNKMQKLKAQITTLEALSNLGVPNVWDGIERPENQYKTPWVVDWLTHNVADPKKLKRVHESLADEIINIDARVLEFSQKYPLLFDATKKSLITESYYTTIVDAEKLAKHYVQTIGTKP
jgi:hypothetical protein